MLIAPLKRLLERDLLKLKAEIEAYENEAIMWQTEKSIANSAGNLCLHIMGSLNTFIGALFGDTGYVRNRTFEFAAKHVPKAELLTAIDETRSMVQHTLDRITEEQLNAQFPYLFYGEVSNAFFLVHLSTHTAYHLGQINYHRRLLDQ